AEALNAAIYVPLRARFPQAHLVNWTEHFVSQQFPVPDANGHRLYDWGPGEVVGDTQDVALYAADGSLRYQVLSGTMPYGVAPFDVSRFDVNQLRGARLSAPAFPVQPWVPYEGFTTTAEFPGWEPTHIYLGTELWTETIFHTVLSGSDTL